MELSFDLSKYIRTPKITKAEKPKDIEEEDIPRELRNIKAYSKKGCFFYMHRNIMFNQQGMMVIPVIYKGKPSIVCRHAKEGFNHLISKRIDKVIDDQIEMMLKQEKEVVDNIYTRQEDKEEI